MNLAKSEEAPQSFPIKPPSTCPHSRLISDSVSEEERKAGKVQCVECGSVIPDPHFRRESKKT
jgi:hypothetical protein